MSISLDDHEKRIKDIDSKIVEINDKIANIIATAKSWEILSLGNANSTSISYPSKYTNFKVIILNVDVYGYDRTGNRKFVSISNNGTSYRHEAQKYAYYSQLNVSKTSTQISFYFRNDSSGENQIDRINNVIAMFYK